MQTSPVSPQQLSCTETRNSRSAVKRFRAFVSTERPLQPRTIAGEDQSCASPEKTPTVSTMSDLNSQLSSRRSLFSRGTVMEQIFQIENYQRMMEIWNNWSLRQQPIRSRIVAYMQSLRTIL